MTHERKFSLVGLFFVPTSSHAGATKGKANFGPDLGLIGIPNASAIFETVPYAYQKADGRRSSNGIGKHTNASSSMMIEEW